MLIKGLFGAVPHRLLKPDDDGAGGAGGGGTGGTGNDNGEGGSGDDKVDLKTHKAVLDKMHSQNADLKKLQAANEKLQNEMKALQTKKSEDGGDFKNLYETTRAEKEQLETKYNGLKTSVFNNERLRSLESELKKLGLKAGNESVIDFANLEEMPTEQTSLGRVLVHGVEEQAKKLKEKYSFAFATGTTPKINNGGAGGGNGGGGDKDGSEYTDEQLTPAFMIELEMKDKAMYRKLHSRFAKLMASRR